MIVLTGKDLSIEQVAAVARDREQVFLDESACERVRQSRALVEKFVAENRIVYGITTGFGKFSDVLIDPCDVSALQHNLIQSHCCAVGELLPIEVVRAMMLIRANSLMKGNSGIRLSIIELLIKMLNAGLHPHVPSQGSLGASGDLAPLANMVLPLIGEGSAEYRGKIYHGADALAQIGEKPVKLVAKEGLALINGTQAMTAIAALLVYDSEELMRYAIRASAMTFEALLGIGSALDTRVHEARNQSGQIAVAKALREQLKGSQLISKQGELRVQDAYSLRCAPQVLGASYDAIAYVRQIVEREINAATDNPLIFTAEKDAISAGNFHGQPIALAMDFLKIALSEIANISERRIERLVNPCLSNGLPGFLVHQPGLQSGFMIVQYSAASLVSENKVLAHPASVDSIPSSGNQEDHVSMGTTAARQARMIYNNSLYVVMMEMMVAAQALEFRDKEKMAPLTRKTYNAVRRVARSFDCDRVVNTDIEALKRAAEEKLI